MEFAASDLDQLHAALLAEDASVCARILPRATVGLLAAREEAGNLVPIRVRDSASKACLLVFLTHESWLQFKSVDDVLLVRGNELPRWIAELLVDVVVFNPAGPGPMQVEAEHVSALASGEVVTGPGAAKVMAAFDARADRALTRVLRERLASLPDVTRDVIGFVAVRGGQSHPTVGVRSGGATSAERIIGLLQPAEAFLPPDLETMELPEELFVQLSTSMGEEP